MSGVEILNRVLPVGSKAQYFALRSLTNNRFVGVVEFGRLRASFDKITLACLFEFVRIGSGDTFGLRSVLTGCWVSHESVANPVLQANTRPGSWFPDTWETFTAIEGTWSFEHYGLALVSGCNKKIVAAMDNGAGYLQARSDGPYAWEHFRLMPVLNMPQVLTAFADLHPGQCKVRTYTFDDSALGWEHTGWVFERRPYGSELSANQIATTFMSDNWNNGNGTDHSYCTTDFYYLDNDRVGIAGNYDQKYELENGPARMVGYNTFGAYRGIFSAPDNNYMLKMADKYMVPDMADIQYPVVSSWINWHGPGADVQADTTVCYNVVQSVGVRDTGNGFRWMIEIASDQRYPDSSGHSGGWPYEHCFYDLGPALGVYDPALGFVGYRQTYVGPNGVPNGRYAEEFYAQVASGEFHRDVTSFLSF